LLRGLRTLTAERELRLDVGKVRRVLMDAGLGRDFGLAGKEECLGLVAM
jgi:hypothetical protein